jgi:CYTH domain-containing protein
MTEFSLMRTTRCFLLAPSLARVIEKERGGHQVTEGYFADQPRGNTYVRLEEGIGSLVLVRHGSGERVEEPTDLPRSQTEALLDLTPGGVTYRRIPLSFGPSRAQVLRFTAPGSLDLVSVEFDDHARDFQPLPWFGLEVTTEPSYQNRSVALAGLPEPRKVELTDAALDSLLDTLEDRVVAWHPPKQRTWLKQRAAS